MQRLLPNTGRRTSRPNESAFTLTELLVVGAVIGVLVALRVTAMAAAKDRSKIAQCAGNLRQFDLAAHIFAYENNNKLPALSAGFWPWDLDLGVANALNSYGAPREVMYCPANPGQNVDGLWSYATNSGTSFRVIGYAMAFASGASLTLSNLNQQITPQPLPVTVLGGVVYPTPHAKDRPLLADATLSLPGQSNPTPSAESSYQWSNIPGGYAAAHRTSHLNRTLPAGGNIAMLDGHVEWRRFPAMLPRTSGSSPVFWW